MRPRELLFRIGRTKTRSVDVGVWENQGKPRVG